MKIWLIVAVLYHPSGRLMDIKYPGSNEQQMYIFENDCISVANLYQNVYDKSINDGRFNYKVKCIEIEVK